MNHDHAAERMLLCAAMNDPAGFRKVTGILSYTDFHDDLNAAIFAVIHFLSRKEKPFDPLVVAAELNETPGAREHLASLLTESANDPTSDTNMVRLANRLARLGAVRVPGYPLDDLMSAALDEIEASGSREEGLVGVPSGFAELDLMLGGFRRGLVYLLFGPTGVGTSTLAFNFTRTASIKHGLSSLYFSGQSPRNELINRLLGSESRVAGHSLRNGYMVDDEWTRLARRMSEVAEAPLYIDDNPSLEFSRLAAKCRQLKELVDLRLIVVDGVNLYARPTAPESLWAAQTRLSADLKRLAADVRLPIIITAPTNRRAEGRVDHRPHLADIASSSAYANDADVVIGLHREDYYEMESPRAGEADLRILKNRHGVTGTVTLGFQGHYSRFVDLSTGRP